jgi:hypothetical protein
MTSIPMPDDLKLAPFEVVRDFIEMYNKAKVSNDTDPMSIARSKLAKKYGQKENKINETAA